MNWTSSTESALNCIYHLPKMSFQRYYHFLYGYNRLPLTMMQNASISVPKFLDTYGLYKLWNDGYWVHLIRNKEIEFGQMQSIFKLYLGVDPRYLSSSFDSMIDRLLQLDPIGMKWGSKQEYLLRPDRCMVYFYSMDQIVKASEIVLEEIDGLHFQDVPFSIRVNSESPISFGIDPPDASQKHISWRSDVCKKMAAFAMKKNSMIDRHEFIKQARRELEKYAEDAKS